MLLDRLTPAYLGRLKGLHQGVDAFPERSISTPEFGGLCKIRHIGAVSSSGTIVTASFLRTVGTVHDNMISECR